MFYASRTLFAAFMLNLSHPLLQPYREHQPDFSLPDLNAHSQARSYLTETMKMLPKPPDGHLVLRISRHLKRFGGIRTRQNDAFPT